MEQQFKYEYATLQEVKEFLDRDDVVEISNEVEGEGRGRTEITVWSDGVRTLRCIDDYGCFDYQEKFEWVSSRTPSK
jgi:hypothetical protein